MRIVWAMEMLKIFLQQEITLILNFEMKHYAIFLMTLCLLLEHANMAPSPHRRRYHHRHHSGYYSQPSNSNTYLNTIVPLKVAGGVGLVGGLALAQVLNG